MLDARRTTLQLPLMREVTALQKKNLRTLQDPGTSSSTVTTSGGSSAGGNKRNWKGKTQTFIGDPHQDAQALARELSGNLAKSTSSVVDHGATTATTRPPQSTKRNLRVDKLQTRRRRGRSKSTIMTAEDATSEPEMEVGVRERIQRIESAVHETSTVSGEHREQGLKKTAHVLLRNHDDSNGYVTRSAPNLQRVVQDERLFESTDDEGLNPGELLRGRSAAAAAKNAPRLRGKDELRKPIRKKQKPGRERSIKVARRKEPPPVAATIVLDDDDELAVSELPNGCGVDAWDWSRIHKYGGRALLDITGLTCTLPEPPRHDLELELHPPVQSISSLDSDANALPLILGDDAQDSDVAGYYFRSRQPGEQKAKAVSDVPGDVSATTVPPPHRTLTQKYRPKNFKEIVGQSVVVKSLYTAILKSRVAPVYLFVGPRGTGKTSTARVFAAGLNCLSLDLTRRPCGICRECGTLALNRSADVLQIDAATYTDLANLRATMGTFTPHARYKVFVVENCDQLSIDIWNSFLKLLEEPPVNVVFILVTTDAERIPATAASRCQRFQFSKVKEVDIVKRLEVVAGREGLVVEAGAFALIASTADGSLRDAEIMLDQLCLLHRSVSVAAVQELVGLLPDQKLLDLLDYALSANTVNIVRTMREVLAVGVEPQALVSQLGALITDILVGSVEVNREKSPGFFARRFSEKEEAHRLRQALKILSEAEKQLRVSADGATWLTAALLQFAPDRSFLLSDGYTTSVPPSPDVMEPRDAPYDPDNDPDNDPEIEDLDDIQMALATLRETAGAGYPTPEVEHQVTTLSEQKLEEAWAGEPPQQQQQDLLEGAPVEFQVFGFEALAELWKRVVWEVAPRNLKNMLQTQGRLVAAGVAIDGSCAVVELEFDYASDKHKAERSWRSICVAFQAVLSTAVELRIALSDAFPDESDVVRVATSTHTPPPASPSGTQQPKPDPDPDPASPRRHRRRGTRARRRRHATNILEQELGAQFSSDDSEGTPRRPPPPGRRRRVKKLRGSHANATVGTEMVVRDGPGSLTREIWDSLSPMDTKPEEKKKLLSSMMEEPQSDIDDLRAAQSKILKQRNLQFWNDPSMLAIINRRTSLTADLQRGLPVESSLVCWKRASPQSDFLMRKAKVKSLSKPAGKTLFLKLVPCAATHITSPSTAPPRLPQLTAA